MVAMTLICRNNPHLKGTLQRVKGNLGSFAFTWEQRKLGECFDERQERSAEGELISVTINEGIKRFSDLGRHDNSSEDKSHYKKVGVGDIAYNSMRMWQGASGFSPYSGILSPAYTVVIPKADVDSLFFSYVFKKPQIVYFAAIAPLARRNSPTVTAF